VRVRPDTTGFEPEVKRLTSKKRKTLIQAVLDSRQAQAELDKLKGSRTVVDLDVRLDKASREVAGLKAKLAALQDTKLRIGADSTIARANLSALQVALKQATGDKKVSIRADVAEAKAKVSELARLMAENKALTVNATADTKKAQKELRALEGDKKAVVKAEAETAAAKAELAYAARTRIVNLLVRIHKSAAMTDLRSMIAGMSGLSMLQQWGRSLQNFVTNLPQAAAKVGMLATSVGGLGAVAVSAVGGLGPLVGSLKDLAGAALFLPAAAGAAVAGIAVLVTAWKDVKNAASVSDDAEAFAAALEGLPPAAQDAARAMGPLYQRLKGLKEIILDNYWGGVAEDMTRLGETVIPQLERGLAGVSASLGLVTKEVMGGLNETLGDGRLEGFAANLAQMFEESASGFAGIFAGLTNLAMAGGQILPDIGHWVTRIGEKFNTWTLNADIEGMMRNAAAQAGHLVDLLGNVGDVLGAVFASSPSTGLEGAANATARLRDVLRDPVIQRGLGHLFAGASAGAQAMARAFDGMGPTVQRILSTVGMALHEFGEAAGVLFAGVATALANPAITEGIHDLAEGAKAMFEAIDFDMLGEAAGTLLSVLGQIMPLVGEIVNNLLPALSPILAGMGELAAPLLEIVSALSPIIADIASAIGVMAGILGEAMAGILPTLTPIIENLRAGLSPILTQVVELLRDHIVPAATKMISEIGPRMGELITNLLGLISALMPVLGPVLDILYELMTAVLVPLLDVINLAIPAVTAVVNAIMPSVQKLFDFVSGIVSAISALLRGDFSGAWEAAKGAVVRVVTDMWGNITKMASGVKAALGEVGRVVSGMRDTVVNALGNAGRWLWDSGRKIIGGLIDGIRSMVGAARDAIGGVVSSIRDFLPFSPAKVGPFSGKGSAENSGKAIARDLGAGMVAAARDAARGASVLVGAAAGEIDAWTPSISADLGVAGEAGAAGVDGLAVSITFGDVHVRSEQDIRSLSNGIAERVASIARAQGVRGLVPA
jgi:phage-related protein